MDSVHADRARDLLRGEIDWDALTWRARRHGLLTLLYRNLEPHARDLVPRSLLDELRAEVRARARRSLSLTAELVKLVEMLDADGVPAVPFKGPALAALAYGQVSLRHFRDLDLVVRKADVPRACRLLAERGYRAADGMTPAQQRVLLRSAGPLLLQRASDGTVVELHWELTPRYFPFPLPADEAWPHLPRISVAGATVPSLPIEDLPLALCVHGAKHRWERLGWIVDVAELIRACPTLDWAALLARARALGGERMLLLGVGLAGDLLAADLPAPVRPRLEADRIARELVALVRAGIVRGPAGAAEPPLVAPFHFRVRERLGDRVRYALRTLGALTDADVTALRLPAWLAGLYYPLRPLRLAGVQARRLLRRLPEA